ncbi:MAG: response regulator [Acidobacteriota bacterium]
MKVSCPGCSRAFTVDEAKLPPGPVVLKCPACGGRIPVAPPAPAPTPGPPAEAVMDPAPAPAAEAAAPPALPAAGSPAWERLRREVTREVLRSLGLGGGAEEREEDGGLGPEGEKEALVCEDEALFQVAVSEILERMGYRVELAASRDAALEALRKNRYDLVTVDNCFPDDPEGGYAILQAINALPPEVRRRMFVAFVSVDLSTMDTRSAFVLGANLTVSKKDVKRLDRILADGMRAHEKLYRVFRQVEEELQRAEG